MLWVVLAFAGEPEVAFHDDGMMHGQILVDAPAAKVAAVLDNAPLIAKWSPDVISMEPEGEPSAGCQNFAVKTKGLWSPLKYVVRRCRSALSYTDRLVQSDDFSQVTADWVVVDQGESSLVTYVGVVALKMPVPAIMLRKAQTSSMFNTLTKIRDAAQSQ